MSRVKAWLNFTNATHTYTQGFNDQRATPREVEQQPARAQGHPIAYYFGKGRSVLQVP